MKRTEGSVYFSLNGIKKIYLVLFVLLPIINQYQFGSLSFIQIYSMMGVVLWLLFSKKIRLLICPIIYIIYAIMISIIGFLNVNEGSMLQLILRLSAFVVITLNFYIVFPILCDSKFVLETYTIVIYFVTILFYIQYVFYILLGRSFMLIIPNIPLNYNDGINSSEFMAYTLGRLKTGYYYRPASVFIEPGFQAMYCIPWLSIRLFSMKENQTKNVIICLIVTASMILSTSSMAIFSCLIIWGLYFYRIFRKLNKQMLKALLIALPLAIISSIYLLHSSGVLTSISIKLKSFQNIDEGSSLTWRVLRGWECYKGIGLFQKIFGCGYGDVANYLRSIGLQTIYDSNLTLIDYMSGGFYMLCSVGLIGSLLLGGMVGRYLRIGWKNMQMRVLFICLLVVMFSAAIFDTDKYFLFLGLIICLSLQGRNDHHFETDLVSIIPEL